MSWDSKKYGTEHYPEGEFDAFKDGERVDVDSVTIRAKAVREREQRHDRRDQQEEQS